MLSKDTFHLSLSFLSFKETFNVLLLCKIFNKWWVNWSCQEVIKIKDINIVDRYKYFKFSLNLSYTKITDISKFDVKNLHSLDLGRTNITDISRFDVKSLLEIDLRGTNITDEEKNELRKKVKNVY